MKSKTYLMMLLSLFMMTGCSIKKPVEAPKNFAIVANQPVETLSKRYDTVLIDSVQVDEPFNDTQMVYRLSDVNFESDYYNRYITAPAAIVENQLSTWLTRSGVVSSTLPYNANISSDYVLKAVITKLFGDFRSEVTPYAVMEIQFILIDRKEIRPLVIFDKKISSEVVLTERTPDELAKGLGRALSQILENLSLEISKL